MSKHATEHAAKCHAEFAAIESALAATKHFAVVPTEQATNRSPVHATNYRAFISA